ncbi:glutamyl-tRNA(Gln) amidotransferase subunit C chloroplastic/mitochondrial [Tripterygium wilfordii]|uniref:Glutamyl-tRNA(Gln) amidotransferase subunit C, chloroplastic/mitochondrial n=1 Tax=Tripterygium wilfordii TaxID=458696 RepID=A0A7J7BWH5_TRIWF|nr:glutamyl-tRNA(Gln) amidotransferase subunit C, chloroplastic/mitochondrial isoform X2 [Tripterygium wilfordii]KAF5726178.1 glutamyl-tRNA(Gln) amidotransferase subunit C chloroplastic/mitochondrial [Tripterygium wilfordii]
MASRGLLLFKAPLPKQLCFSPKFPLHCNILNGFRSCSTTTTTVSSLPPPDVARLAETARITLTPQEVEEFAPKIRQMVDWFGQLQAVDLSSVEPALRAGTEVDSFRDDIPESFENRNAMINAVPSYEEPYIKVPKVLNKE